MKHSTQKGHDRQTDRQITAAQQEPPMKSGQVWFLQCLDADRPLQTLSRVSQSVFFERNKQQDGRTGGP